MSLKFFETIVRRTVQAGTQDRTNELQSHPFELRNIHSDLPPKVRRLFDDGHYSESTFEAFKYVDKTVQKLSLSNDIGVKLMMSVFSEDAPKLRLTALSNPSEIDEQKGYRFLFSGAVMAIRNPRGHEVDVNDDPDTCLDHLAFASLLIRRLEQREL
jgi:uncharacterized protein (TIGR02391 family)